MIRIKIAAYALNDFLWACYCSNIKDITVTKEDNELIIYLKLEVTGGSGTAINTLEGINND
jgi:hypothetical protein